MILIIFLDIYIIYISLISFYPYNLFYLYVLLIRYDAME